MVMTLNPHEFMATMEKRMSFTDEDKALLKSQVTWGQQIASEMAVHFYAYIDYLTGLALDSKTNCQVSDEITLEASADDSFSFNSCFLTSV
jgi:hypothetical protein